MSDTKKEKIKISFTSYQKFLIVILALIQFTVVLDFMILSPLGDILIKSLSMTPQRFGMVVSAYAISAFAAGIFAAGFADKFDRKKLLLFFYAGFVLGTLFCGLANTYWTLLLARIITGLFGGVMSSISLAIVTDKFEIHQRGRVMGFVQMAFAGSQILGIPIGLAIAAHYNWHYTFIAIVAFATILGIVVMVKMEPIVEHLKLQSDKNAFQHLIHTFSNKNYQVGFLATAMLSIGGFMLMPFSSAFLVNNVNIAQTELPMVFMFTGMSSIIIMPLIGRLSDRFDKFRLFTAGSIVAIIMVIIYTNLPAIPLWQVVAINMLLFMGIMGRMVPATALNTAVPDLKDRGAFMSINSSLQYLAGGISALFAGMIVHQETKTSPLEHFDTLGYVVATIILICLFFVYRVSRLVKSKQQTQ
jgi:predicted MFS family arabinose efflux permease